SRGNLLSFSVVADVEELVATGHKPDFAGASWPPNGRTKRLRPAQYFLIQHRTVHLIRWHARQVASANFATVGERGGAGVVKPETHALFDQVRFVQMLRKAEHASQKVAADFDGRLADATSKGGGLLHDKDFQLGLLTEQENSCGSPGQSATNDDDIKML